MQSGTSTLMSNGSEAVGASDDPERIKHMGYSSMVMADNINGNGDGPGGRNETYRGAAARARVCGHPINSCEGACRLGSPSAGEESPVARACRERVSGAEPLGEVFE
jgi:hypothetical protein